MVLRSVTSGYAARVLPVTIDIAETYGRFNVSDPLPAIDSLIAATAHAHGMTVVTRNADAIARAGVPVINPFNPATREGSGTSEA